MKVHKLQHAINPESAGKARAPLVCVILGQTASGKSALSQTIANRLDAEIVSMDALKVYRGMDIGTAKASKAEQAEIPHHMLDLVEPHESFNVSRYLELLEPVIKGIHSRGRLPVIDCGTPMYLQAFLSGMIEGPPPNPELRAELEALSSEELHAKLEGLDADAAKRLHVNDRLRVVRALEYALQAGEPISDAQTHFGDRRDDFRFVLTGPVWSDDALRARMNLRIDRMMEAGLLDEVRRILAGNGFSKSGGDAIGYRQLIEHLRGDYSLDEVVERMRHKTWQLSRRQMRWFRKHEGVKWLNVSHEDELKRAGIFLATEMIGEMRITDHGIPLSLRKEPRTRDI